MYHEKYDTWNPGGHVGTFRGHVPAMRGGTAAIEYIQHHNLLDHAEELGEYIRARLREIQSPYIGEVRGKGLFIGAEFVDGESITGKGLVKAVRKQCYENGVLVWKAGREGNVLRLLPPLVTTTQQAEIGMDIVCDAIQAVSKRAA